MSKKKKAELSPIQADPNHLISQIPELIRNQKKYNVHLFRTQNMIIAISRALNLSPEAFSDALEDTLANSDYEKKAVEYRTNKELEKDIQIKQDDKPTPTPKSASRRQPK